MKTKISSAAEVLKLPYARVVTPEEDGSFRAEIMEFPGCIALADSAASALASLEDVATSWLEGTIAQGLPVPPPVEQEQFSGKFVLRLPKSLHRNAAHAAKRNGVSLNQYIVSSLALEVGMEKRQSVTTQSTIYSVSNFMSAGNQVVAIVGNSRGTSSLQMAINQLPAEWQQFTSSFASNNRELVDG